MTIQIRQNAAINKQPSGLAVARATTSVPAVSASEANNPGVDSSSPHRTRSGLLAVVRARLGRKNTKGESMATAEMGATVGYPVVANRREPGLRRSCCTSCDSTVSPFTWDIGFNRFGESAFSLGATTPTTADALLASRQWQSQSSPNSGHDCHQRSKRPGKRPVPESTGGIFCIGDSGRRFGSRVKRRSIRPEVASPLAFGDVRCLDRPSPGRLRPWPPEPVARQEKERNAQSIRHGKQRGTARFRQNDCLAWRETNIPTII